MDQLLQSLGINIASSLIYDFFKKILETTVGKEDLKNKLSSFLNIENPNIYAENIINFMAKNGDLKIEGTNVYANNSVNIFSSQNTNFSFGSGSTSSTKNTKIVTQEDSYIHGQGGAGLKQNEDGSISFFV
jgi:hypothetical protein